MSRVNHHFKLIVRKANPTWSGLWGHKGTLCWEMLMSAEIIIYACVFTPPPQRTHIRTISSSLQRVITSAIFTPVHLFSVDLFVNWQDYTSRTERITTWWKDVVWLREEPVKCGVESRWGGRLRHFSSLSLTLWCLLLSQDEKRKSYLSIHDIILENWYVWTRKSAAARLNLKRHCWALAKSMCSNDSNSNALKYSLFWLCSFHEKDLCCYLCAV